MSYLFAANLYKSNGRPFLEKEQGNMLIFFSLRLIELG